MRAVLDNYEGAETLYGYDEFSEEVDSIEYNRRQYIIDDRRRRERELVGKYIIVASSRYKRDLDLFLQDNKFGEGYWTKFLSNARGFYDESAAIVKAKNLQFNNPRVMLMQANGKLKEVYNNSKCVRR